MICVLLLANGEHWESSALSVLDAQAGVVVLKRCVDVDDLVAAATSDQADVAVLALGAPGLDPSTVAHLRRHGVRVVAVGADSVDDLDVREHLGRLSIPAFVPASDIDALVGAVTAVDGAGETRAPDALGESDRQAASSSDHLGRRIVAVWGPTGAPGRTTVAVTLATEVARRGTPVVLVDADPYGGSVAQQLGVVDEVSGLLSASRLAGAGQLAERFDSVCRGLGQDLAVVTGLPRADRWREVRGSHVDQLLETASGRGHVVVDTGFCLEDDPGSEFGGRPSRNAMTLAALDAADEIVVVGAADPVGLSRLARALVELRERAGGVPTRVVVNRMRPTIGWSEKEIAAMVEGFARITGLHFLPEDRVTVDRALVAGRSVAEGSSTVLALGVSALADTLFPGTVQQAARRRGRLPWVS